MARSKQRRIFLRDGDYLYNFMWADIIPDASVVLGLSSVQNGEISAVFSPAQGYLHANDFQQVEGNCAGKFTFHASGNFKGEGRIGLDQMTLDRPTIAGCPLSEIFEPIRMLEILLPKNISCTKHRPRENDLVLSFISNPDKPLRCAISCMAISKFQSIPWDIVQILENSIWEKHDALATDKHAWVWTIGQCHGDHSIPSDFFVAMPGNIRWGRMIDEPVV